MAETPVSRMWENCIHRPPEVAEVLIPAKSKQLYEDSYLRLMRFCKGATNFSESVLLAYFLEMSKTCKNSTLWTKYSMIKAELKVKHNININGYNKVITFLKQNREGYQAKTCKILTKAQFDTFLQNAPDSKYLATKMVLIFGVCGACKCDELMKLTGNDITDLDNLLLVKIQKTSSSKPRSFTIVDDACIELYRKYAALRPKDLKTPGFFIKYVNGKCHRVVMGGNKIKHAGREVASFLKLPNALEYTGHCLRKSAATILMDQGRNKRQVNEEENVGNPVIEQKLSNPDQHKILSVPRLVRDLTPSHFSSPNKITKSLDFVKRVTEKKNAKIKRLRTENLQMRTNADRMKNFLVHLKYTNLITEDAEVLIVQMHKHLMYRL